MKKLQYADYMNGEVEFLEQDKEVVVNLFNMEVDMFVDDSGRVFTEGGDYVADVIKDLYILEDLLEQKHIDLEDLEVIEEHEAVKEVEGLGMSGDYPSKLWFIVTLVDYTEHDVYIDRKEVENE